VPGVAAADAPDGEPGAAAGAVERERLEGVLGARRVEAAPRRQVHADEPPGADRQHEEPGEERGPRDVGRGCRGHAASSRTAARSVVTCSHSVGKGTVITGRSAANRYAPPGTSSPASSATAARSRRRARLRSTAAPKCRPMAYATRGGSSDPSVRKRSETGPARRRRALARASNVARSRTRQIRPRDASARGRGGRAGRRDPPWCACGGGNRGSWRACDCWVGTCASTKSLLEAVARGPESGTTREAETAKCTARIAPFATRSGERHRSGENPRNPLSHKDAGATLRALCGDGPPFGLPRCVSARPGRPFEHLYDDLHTCGRSCGQLPATADAPGSGNPVTAAGGREKNGER